MTSVSQRPSKVAANIMIILQMLILALVMQRTFKSHPLTSKARAHVSELSYLLFLFIAVARKLIFTVYHASITAVIFNAIITLQHTRNPVNGSHFSNYRFDRTTILSENEQNSEDGWTKDALLKVCCLKGGEFSFTLCKYRRR